VAALPNREHEALRSTVTQLAAIGRNLNVMARTTLAGAATPAPSHEHVLQMLRVCEATISHVKRLMHANIASWEVGYAKATD
jgi:hypothetical protein